VNQPTPAIVAQSAVRRLPRLALLLFCAAYVLPGFIGRGRGRTRTSWPSATCSSWRRGRQLALAHLLGQPPEFDALLPYWLGAWAMKLAPAWMAPDFAARLPFIGCWC
jgi:hypothetical protein